MLRHSLEVGLDLAPADHRAGRVVRVAEVDDLRAWADLAEDRVDVIAVVRERDPFRARAELEGVEDVAREGGPATDDLVAWVEHGDREVHDHGVGARRDRHVLQVDSVALGERGAEKVGASVRVAVQPRRTPLDRLERFRERAVLALRWRRA